MNVHEILAEAWKAVEASKVPDSVQEVAFREAVRLIAKPDPGAPNPTPPPGARPPLKKAAKKKPDGGRADAMKELGSGSFESASELYSAITAETAVPTEKLERVFHIEDGEIAISLSRGKLGDSARSRQVTIAQLLCSARHFALHEEGTSIRLIRAEASRLGTLDTNINSYVDSMSGYSYVGPKGDKRLKLQAKTESQFPSLIDRVLGESTEGDG